MIRGFTFLFLFFSLSVQAQFTYVLDTSIPVLEVNGDTLAMPWAGGINAAQHNTMDLNGDNKMDLVLFDRMANKVTTFINQNNNYQYAAQYEVLFPEEVSNWILLRDYNCDGKKDLFTGNTLGMKVYRNTTQPGENISWEPILFFDPEGDSKSPVLLTKGFSGLVNLQLQYDDLPAISDMDGDGDLDIMNVGFIGNGTVEYHQNFSKERYGTCDSLDFERITQKWGNFTECECGSFAFGEQSCPPEGGGRTKHASGKSLLTFDIDGDNDQDLLFSESSCTQLYLLKNEGSDAIPVINSFSIFPSQNPVNFLIFPGAFYEDVDFDGREDLIATPNIYSKAYLNTNLQASNWLYKNTGTQQAPTFTFSKTNFLQESMIDVGDNAIPTFADYDGDGDYDLLISQNGTENYVASIYLYENEGSIDAPQFRLITNDYLNFSLNTFYNLKIQCVDINGDAKIDLVFTAVSFQNSATNLYYLINKGSGMFDFSGQTMQNTNFTISYSENIYVNDVNLDGFADLLVGKNNGAVEFWKNPGPRGNINFVLEDESFLGLGSSILRQNPACFIADLDADGKEDFIRGDQRGNLNITDNFREAGDATNPVTDIVFNPLLADYTTQNLGGRVWPVAINLFNLNRPAIVVGNTLGGIRILQNEDSQELSEIPVVEIYPNPVYRQETLYVKSDRSVSMQIFTALGQQVNTTVSLQGNQLNLVKVSTLSSGVYLFRFTTNQKSITKRIVVY